MNNLKIYIESDQPGIEIHHVQKLHEVIFEHARIKKKKKLTTVFFYSFIHHGHVDYSFINCLFLILNCFKHWQHFWPKKKKMKWLQIARKPIPKKV